MTIQNLIDQFEIQGAFVIKMWHDTFNDYILLAVGNDFECDRWDIDERILGMKISYMYAVDGALIIEVE